jgi:hypothetical protein
LVVRDDTSKQLDEAYCGLTDITHLHGGAIANQN